MSDYWPDSGDCDGGSSWNEAQCEGEWEEDALGDSIVRVAHGGVVHQTAKAVLYRFGDRDVWLPKSGTKDDGERISMPRWLATKNRLEVEAGS